MPIGEFEVNVFYTFEEEKEDDDEERGEDEEEQQAIALRNWEARKARGVLPESISIVLRRRSIENAKDVTVEKWEMFIKSVLSLVESEEAKRVRLLVNTRQLPATLRRYEEENWGRYFDAINADYPFNSFENYASGFDGNGWEKWTFTREHEDIISDEDDEDIAGDGDIIMVERG